MDDKMVSVSVADYTTTEAEAMAAVPLAMAAVPVTMAGVAVELAAVSVAMVAVGALAELATSVLAKPAVVDGARLHTHYG